MPTIGRAERVVRQAHRLDEGLAQEQRELGVAVRRESLAHAVMGRHAGDHISRLRRASSAAPVRAGSPRQSGKGARRAAGSLRRRRSARGADCPAMLGPRLASPNSLRSLRSLRSDSGDESDGRARCARGPRALRFSAPPRRTRCPHAPLLWQPAANSGSRGFAVRPSFAAGASRQAVPGGGDFGGDEQRRAGLGARSALRCLTHRRCLSAVSAANEASSAMRARTEQRTAVGATRRPPPYEPPTGAACRDARMLRREAIQCRIL